jgi:hypothetical protein
VKTRHRGIARIAPRKNRRRYSHKSVVSSVSMGTGKRRETYNSLSFVLVCGPSKRSRLQDPPIPSSIQPFHRTRPCLARPLFPEESHYCCRYRRPNRASALNAETVRKGRESRIEVVSEDASVPSLRPRFALIPPRGQYIESTWLKERGRRRDLDEGHNLLPQRVDARGDFAIGSLTAPRTNCISYRR